MESPRPVPDESDAEAFRRAWLRDYSALIGPPTALLGLWILWTSGWPLGGALAVTTYIVFNIAWSELETRRLPVTRGSHPRAWANFLLSFAIFSQLGDNPGAWTLAVSMVFGAMGSPTSGQTRYILALGLAGLVLGSLTCDVAWQTVAVQAAGLLTLGAVSERLYLPLLDNSVAAAARERELAKTNTSLEQALHTRKVFLATMSHEIRTPMNGVLGMTELLGGTMLDEEQRRMLEVIERSGEGLLQIIDDILDISKLEAGRVQLEQLPSDVEQLTRDLVELLERGDPKPKVELRLHTKELPSQLVLDPTRLRQVLLNLIGNARKFTERGRVDVRLAWSDQRLRVEVEDTGIGMSSEARARLFEPFAQADASTTRRFGGTGLGLSISQRLIQLMGGELELESELGVGSVFRFWLPARALDTSALVSQTLEGEEVEGRPDSGEKEPCDDPTPEPRAEILLVDDNPVNLMVAKAMLEKLGCIVLAVDTGEKAMEAAAARPQLDLILLDCQMPGMDGFETCRQLRASGWTRPILALTAGVTEEENEACSAAGMDAVLTKPNTTQSFADALLRWRGVQTQLARDGI